MDFKAVFRNLLEIFPQVDTRILKAVAIEHPRDSDAAAEFILYEVLSSLGEHSKRSHTGHDIHDVSTEVPTRDQDLKVGGQVIGTVQPGSKGHPISIFDDSASLPPFCAEEFVIDTVNDETDDQCSSLLVVENHRDLVGYGDTANGIDSSVIECEGQVLSTQFADTATAELKSSNDASPSKTNIMSLQKYLDHALAENEEHQSRCLPDISEHLAHHIEMVSLGDKDLPMTPLTQLTNADPPEDHVIDAHLMSSPVFEIITDIGEHTGGVPKDNGIVSGGDESCHSGSLDGSCSELLRCSSEMVLLEENDVPILASRSGYTVDVDLLDDFVTDAKSDKKNLVSSVESVVNMMKEADAFEERAKVAKEEASFAGQDTLTQVVELKQMLEHAKQANDMHSGEVYGEKAILSTEARELQSRVLSLSDERDKSFSVIEEVQRTLQARIAAAENEIAAAEQEKLRKEESAQKALNEQEAIMDAIVQESKKLQQEAEENAKLRDFLMDRGSVVDALQGEMAVILEDVMLLKERVDGRLPLGGSLMATYSSASSSASSFSHKSKSLAGSDVQILEPSKISKENGDLSRSREQAVQTANGGKTHASSDEQKQNSDDDWEVFEREDWPF